MAGFEGNITREHILVVVWAVRGTLLNRMTTEHQGTRFVHVAALFVPDVRDVDSKERFRHDLLIGLGRGNLYPADVVGGVLNEEGFEG
jgi:hypothetical protein